MFRLLFGVSAFLEASRGLITEQPINARLDIIRDRTVFGGVFFLSGQL